MTVSTLRPNGTTTFSDTVTGAANAHTALSDDSDASYITLPAFHLWQGGLTDLSLPAGAVIKTVWSRVRVANSGSSINMTVHVAPPTGDALALADAGIGWTSPTTFYAGSTSRTGISEGDLNGATLYIAASVPSGASLKVYEAYVDVVYVVQPAATVDAPTGTVTNTNLPTVEWVDDLDDDGGEVVSVRVGIAR